MEGSCILCAKIIQNPAILATIKDKYVIIWDQSLTSFKWDNIVKAINIMAQLGWRCVNITSMQATGGLGGMYGYALMERIT